MSTDVSVCRAVYDAVDGAVSAAVINCVNDTDVAVCRAMHDAFDDALIFGAHYAVDAAIRRAVDDTVDDGVEP